MIVSIAGGSITSVTAAAGYQIRTSALGQSPLRPLIHRPVAAGKLADLQATARKAAFTVTVQAASAGQMDNYAVIAPAGHQGMVA